MSCMLFFEYFLRTKITADRRKLITNDYVFTDKFGLTRYRMKKKRNLARLLTDVQVPLHKKTFPVCCLPLFTLYQVLLCFIRFPSWFLCLYNSCLYGATKRIM